MVELKYSKNKTPYIEVPTGKIIFSRALKTNKGFKWFTFSYGFEDVVNVGAGQAIVVSMRNSTAFDREFQLPVNVLPIDVKNKLKTIFNSLMDEEGYISVENVSLLENILKNTDFDKIYNPKPKRKYKKRKGD